MSLASWLGFSRRAVIESDQQDLDLARLFLPINPSVVLGPLLLFTKVPHSRRYSRSEVTRILANHGRNETVDELVHRGYLHTLGAHQYPGFDGVQIAAVVDDRSREIKEVMFQPVRH